MKRAKFSPAEQMRAENNDAYASIADAIRQANFLTFTDAEWLAYVAKHFGPDMTDEQRKAIFNQAFEHPRGEQGVDWPELGNPHHNDPYDTKYGGGI